MTPDEYVRQVIARHALPSAPSFGVELAKNTLEPIIRQWAGQFLLGYDYSGSTAKGTGIIGTTDADLFISLSPNTTETLREIYQSLAGYCQQNGYLVRRQNVSIGLNVGTVAVDLVPGKKHAGNTNDHSLYRSKADTWTQTNVATHVRYVAQSGRLEEIRAAKIWRKLLGLDFPSFYLEMSVIIGLSGKHGGQPASNFLTFLEYLSGDWQTAVIVDPANTNNRLSDDLSQAEKAVIANAARVSRIQPNWSQIIW